MCLDRIARPKSNEPFTDTIKAMIADGRLQHVETRAGKAVYRQT